MTFSRTSAVTKIEALRRWLLGWRPIETAPANKPVLVRYNNELGKDRIIRAEYCPPRTVEASADAEVCFEYDEERDVYWIEEGWYELIDNWDEWTSARVNHEPTHWHWIPW